MDTDNSALFERLEACTTQELREWLQSLSNAHTPKRAKSTYLKGQIVWLEQAKAAGIEMDPYHQSILDRLSRRNKRHLDIAVGTRLVREWHGLNHIVEVESDGFRYEGRKYASLSEIAREITGTRWSGPRFFGLKDRLKP